ncbi:MAG: zinc ribbon domain-containing protein, partial [Desulfobacterales bacterium]
MSRTQQPSATCPDCSAGIAAGQPFCGACGRRLQSICPDCGASNSPHFHFCGQCGGDLSRQGSLAIDSGGLIREVTASGADILGHPHDALIGKPFSLLVDTDDLVVFFTHWNRLIGSGHPQSLAIDLRSSDLPSRHLQIQMHPRDPSRSRAHYRFDVNDISDLRRYQNQCQDKEDLVNLIEEIIDGQSTPSIESRQAAAKDHLAKICLYVGSRRGFVYRIDPKHRHLHSLIEWRMPEEKRDHRPRPLALDRIPALWRRLVQNGQLVMDDSTPLPEPEKKELAAWRGAEEKAFFCRVIHRGRRPAGVVGMADRRFARWPRDAGALLKLSSRLLEWALPEKGPSTGGFAPPRETRMAKGPNPEPGRYTIPLINLDDLKEIDSEASVLDTRPPPPPQPVSGPSRSITDTPTMAFETDPIQDRKDRQRVLPGADGRLQIICPV